MASGRPRRFDLNLAGSSGRMAARVSEPQPFCWFCDRTTGTSTNEHIFPRWLVKHFGAKGETFEPIRLVHGTTVGSRRPPIPVGNLVAGNVCAVCNNGWMSSLENAASSMLTSRPGRGQMTVADATTLARWFAKTAVALNSSMPYRLLLDAPTRHAIAGGMPGHMFVGLFRSEKQNGRFDQVQGVTPLWFVPSSVSTTSRMAALTETTLVSHIRVADLVGAVICLPAPLDVANLRETFCTQIWPLPAKLPHWSSIQPAPDIWGEPSGHVIDARTGIGHALWARA